MIETSARLLRLLGLFQGRRSWTGAELAERLEVTSRTLRRDVDKLRSLGYPIHSTSGVEGGYQMGAGSTMPPLLLDDDEAIAVAVGLRAAATGAISGAEEAAMRALTKVEQILPPRLRRRAEALQAMVVSAPSPWSPPADAKVLAVVASACREHETLRFDYASHGGEVSRRVVEPHRVVFTGARWYLVAWDTQRADWRTFRLDRVGAKPLPGVRFTPRPGPSDDLAAWVRSGIGLAPPCRARVTLHVSALEAAAAIHPLTGSLEPVDEDSCVLDVRAGSWANMAQYLALLGLDFRVDEPKELRDEVRRIARRYRQALSR